MINSLTFVYIPRRLQYEFNMVMDLLRKGHPTADSKVRMLAANKG